MLKAILKGLLARKLRLLLTALSITLGVAFVAGTFVLTDTMSYTFDRLFDDVTQGVDVTIRSDTPIAGLGEPVPESMVEEIERVDGVETAEGSVTGLAQLVGRHGEVIETQGARHSASRGPRTPSSDTSRSAPGVPPPRPERS